MKLSAAAASESGHQGSGTGHNIVRAESLLVQPGLGWAGPYHMIIMYPAPCTISDLVVYCTQNSVFVPALQISAEGKELAIVPAAPAESVTGTTATAAAARATADSTSSSSIGAAAAAVGGVWGRLKHTVAEAGTAAAAAVADARSTAAAAASAVASAVPGVGRGIDEVTEVADVAAEELTGAAGEGDVEAVVQAFHDAQGGDTGEPAVGRAWEGWCGAWR